MRGPSGCGGGDQHVDGGNTGGFRGEFFCIVEEGASHHAGVDDDDGDLGVIVGEDDGACVDVGLDIVRLATGHTAVDPGRQAIWVDIDHCRSGAEFGTGRCAGQSKDRDNEKGKELGQLHGIRIGRRVPS